MAANRGFSLLHKGLILLAVPVFFQVVLIALVTHLRHSSLQEQAWSRQSAQVQGEAQALPRSLLDVVAHGRGYLLSGNPEFLRRFREVEARRMQFSSCSPNGSLLLVLDINMPRVDGVEVLRRVKATDKYARLPVFMLTTTDDPREAERCYELGCSVYITKPVESAAFVEAIRRLGLLIQVVSIPREAE